MSYIHINGQEVGSENPLPIKVANIEPISMNVSNSIPQGINDIGQTLRGFKEVEILPSGARTSGSQTTTTDAGKYKEAVAFIDVTAVSGTAPALDVKFQIQDPISLKWFDIADLTFTQKTAISSEMKAKSGLLGSKLRCSYAISGTTPSFTFSVGLILKS
jgi:hypothetical protein